MYSIVYPVPTFSSLMLELAQISFCYDAGCAKDQMVFDGFKDAASEWQAHSLQSAVTVPVSSAITSVTAHPDTDEIIAGTEAGMLLLIANE